MKKLVALIALTFAINGCSGSEPEVNEVGREGIGSLEEVEACLEELDLCREAGEAATDCVEELLRCAEVGVDDLPSDPTTCDAVFELCGDHGYPDDLCRLVSDDCREAGGEPWPTFEDCLLFEAICPSLGVDDHECSMLSSLCEGLAVEPPPIEEPELCESIYGQCLSLGADLWLCDVVRADCEASGGEGWPEASDCPRARDLCQSAGYDDSICEQVESVCWGMVEGGGDGEPEPRCQEAFDLCQSYGVGESFCELIRDDCEASGGEAWPTHDDCGSARDLCQSAGYDEAFCDQVEAVCQSMAEEDGEPEPEPEPEGGVECESIPGICSTIGLGEELCAVVFERCEAAEGAFPTEGDCYELAEGCRALGYPEDQCDLGRDYCLGLVP